MKSPRSFLSNSNSNSSLQFKNSFLYQDLTFQVSEMAQSLEQHAFNIFITQGFRSFCYQQIIKYVSWPLIGPFFQIARILTNHRPCYRLDLHKICTSIKIEISRSELSRSFITLDDFKSTQCACAHKSTQCLQVEVITR